MATTFFRRRRRRFGPFLFLAIVKKYLQRRKNGAFGSSKLLDDPKLGLLKQKATQWAYQISKNDPEGRLKR